ncbi:MAG: type III pantothenate kinase, partial [Chitinophagaceae bacterium]
MSTTLCFDFGNTRRKAAIFNNAEIDKVIVLNDDSTTTIQSLIDTYHPDRSILSSVIEHNEAMEELLAAKTKFHKLNH